MSDEEILTKAITKAIAGGWDSGRGNNFRVIQVSGMYADISWGDLNTVVSLANIIFDGGFAKALWGDEMLCVRYSDNPDKLGLVGYPLAEYEYHLQQMVVADNRIKYLGENI